MHTFATFVRPLSRSARILELRAVFDNFVFHRYSMQMSSVQKQNIPCIQNQVEKSYKSSAVVRHALSN